MQRPITELLLSIPDQGFPTQLSEQVKQFAQQDAFFHLGIHKAGRTQALKDHFGGKMPSRLFIGANMSGFRYAHPGFDVQFLDAKFFSEGDDAAKGRLRAAQQGTVRLSTKTLDYNNIDLPTVLRYNFTIQQPFAGWTLRAGYVGTRGNHLMRGYEANLFPPPVKLPDGSLCFPPDASQVRPQDINPNCPPVSGAAAGPSSARCCEIHASVVGQTSGQWVKPKNSR